MKFARSVACAVLLLPLAAAQPPSEQTEATAAGLAAELRQLSLDPDQTYRVRELQLARGDIKIYLTEGVLSFVKEVSGRRVAAVFTTQGVEAGDAEILVLPPQRSERASLASFTKTPNLDEHFTSAIFVFSDDTANQVLRQLQAGEVRKLPDVAAQLAPSLDPLIQQVTSGIDVRLVEALLDNHPAAQGFFYGVIVGRELGGFDVTYEPTEFEPVSVGRTSLLNGRQTFQLWTSFRPRRAPPYVPRSPRVSNYRIDTTIRADLSMSVVAAFDVIARETDGRALALRLSNRLKISSATIDGKPAEVFQREVTPFNELKHGEAFLLISDAALTPGTAHKVELRYQGSVIRQTGDRSYFVDERNAWFPFGDPTLATFDLTFRCPAQLRLVSTGELVSEEVAAGERVVHRRTQVPEPLAGFNLGEYTASTEEHGPYRVECYANRSSAEETADVAKQTQDILDYYTLRWMKLPIHSVAVSPVPGYFGQGFPGLIYLSNVSYIRQESRPAELRNPQLDTFFSELLLPHEVAHQWWGNIVTSANYRASWILEAMANYSALQFVVDHQGAATVRTALDRYRIDLAGGENGKSIESAGPVDFGARLMDTAGMSAWHIVTYEKGSWIFHMLLQRLGEDGFHKMQIRLLQEFAAKPITNEDLRLVASEFLPKNDPDKTLALFFDTWVYGTGIPKMTLNRTSDGMNLTLSGVDEDFTVDVPLSCESKLRKKQVHWVRASAGSTDVALPAGSIGCTLPPVDEFLYSP